MTTQRLLNVFGVRVASFGCWWFVEKSRSVFVSPTVFVSISLSWGVKLTVTFLMRTLDNIIPGFQKTEWELLQGLTNTSTRQVQKKYPTGRGRVYSSAANWSGEHSTVVVDEQVWVELIGRERREKRLDVDVFVRSTIFFRTAQISLWILLLNPLHRDNDLKQMRKLKPGKI